MIKDFFAEQLARIFVEQVKANNWASNMDRSKGRLIKLVLFERITLRDRIFSLFFQ